MTELTSSNSNSHFRGDATEQSRASGISRPPANLSGAISAVKSVPGQVWEASRSAVATVKNRFWPEQGTGAVLSLASASFRPAADLGTCRLDTRSAVTSGTSDVPAGDPQGVPSAASMSGRTAPNRCVQHVDSDADDSSDDETPRDGQLTSQSGSADSHGSTKASHAKPTTNRSMSQPGRPLDVSFFKPGGSRQDWKRELESQGLGEWSDNEDIDDDDWPKHNRMPGYE